SIVSLIGTQPDKAENAVLDLADLFRANLGEADAVATWADEYRMCQGYLRIEQYSLGDLLRVSWHGDELPPNMPQLLRIEQYRLGDRLRVTWQVDELPPNLPMPLLTLQPLLENAILHGLQPSVSGGDIQVVGHYREGRVELLVSNSCPQQSEHRGACMA